MSSVLVLFFNNIYLVIFEGQLKTQDPLDNLAYFVGFSYWVLCSSLSPPAFQKVVSTKRCPSPSECTSQDFTPLLDYSSNGSSNVVGVPGFSNYLIRNCWSSDSNLKNKKA